MTSLREDEIYCYVSPRGKPRSWTAGKTKEKVRWRVDCPRPSWTPEEDLPHTRWEKDGFKIKKFRLVEVK